MNFIFRCIINLLKIVLGVNMELIYMYIKSYRNKNDDDLENQNGFRIEDVGINFSDKFECRAEKSDDEDLDGINLIIEKKQPEYKDFYSENIKSMKVIAGKNGSGKTTLMDILGMTRDDRFNDSEWSKSKKNGTRKFGKKRTDLGYKADYIMIYDISDIDDNGNYEDEFLIDFVGNFRTIEDGEEKRNMWILNLDKSIYGEYKDKNYREGDMLYKPNIASIVKYDFENNKMKSTGKLLCNDTIGNKDLNEFIKYYYLSNKHSNRIKEIRSQYNEGYLVKRNCYKYELVEYEDYKTCYKLFTNLNLKKLIKSETSSNESGIYLSAAPNMKLKYYFNTDMKFDINFDMRDEQLRESWNDILNRQIKNIEKLISVNKKGINDKEDYFIVITKANLKDNIIGLFNQLDDNYQNYDEEDIKRLSKVESEKIYSQLKQPIDKSTDIELDLEEPNNIFQELSYIEQVIEFLNSKINDSNEFDELAIIDDEFINNHPYKKYLNRNLMISRYVLDRILILQSIKEDSSYCICFEDVLKMLMKLDEKYFRKNILEFDLSGSEDFLVLYMFQKMIEWRTVCDDNHNDIHKFQFDIPYASDGEKKMISLLSKLGSILEDETAQHHIILLDEPDREMHPEWSRNFIDIVIKMVEILNEGIKAKGNSARKLSTQIVISTNSPFLLSDIRKEDIVLLDLDESIPSDKRNMVLLENGINKTFGANIHNLLKESFFMSSTIGGFASKKLEQDLSPFKLDDEKFREKYSNDGQEHLDLLKIKYLLDEIGEPILKREIEKEWNKKMELISENTDINAMIDSFKGLAENDQKLFVKKLLENIE